MDDIAPGGQYCGRRVLYGLIIAIGLLFTSNNTYISPELATKFLDQLEQDIQVKLEKLGVSSEGK